MSSGGALRPGVEHRVPIHKIHYRPRPPAAKCIVTHARTMSEASFSSGDLLSVDAGSFDTSGLKLVRRSRAPALTPCRPRRRPCRARSSPETSAAIAQSSSRLIATRHPTARRSSSCARGPSPAGKAQRRSTGPAQGHTRPGQQASRELHRGKLLE